MLNAAPQPGSMWHTPWGELIVLGLANEDRPDVAVIAQLANMRVRSIPLAEFVRSTRRTAAYAQNFGLAPILGTLPIAVANVLKERRRQIAECGHTTQIDDHHTDSVLPGAALNYLFAGMMHLQGTADGQRAQAPVLRTAQSRTPYAAQDR